MDAKVGMVAWDRKFFYVTNCPHPHKITFGSTTHLDRVTPTRMQCPLIEHSLHRGLIGVQTFCP